MKSAESPGWGKEERIYWTGPGGLPHFFSPSHRPGLLASMILSISNHSICSYIGGEVSKTERGKVIGKACEKEEIKRERERERGGGRERERQRERKKER